MNKLLHKSLVVALVAGCGGAGMTPAVHADIQAKITGAQASIQDCYQKALTTNRKLRGMMIVTFATQAKTGQFSEITLRRDEPQDPVLRYCVIQEVAKLKLDKPTDSRLVVESYPIKFEWANP